MANRKISHNDFRYNDADILIILGNNKLEKKHSCLRLTY